MTTDLDVSTRPSKWAKRGVQPAVKSTAKPPLIVLNKLAEKIRVEADPIIKKRLQAEYSAQSKVLEDFTTDTTSQKLGAAIVEIVTTFSPIIDPHPDAEEGIRMPETMSREQWKEVHSRILQCKRAAAGWLSKSRRFASDRWGVDFVEKCEAQMELALGIEHNEANELPQTDHLKIASAIAKRIERWGDVDVATMDDCKRKAILETLRPVVILIERLQCVRV